MQIQIVRNNGVFKPLVDFSSRCQIGLKKSSRSAFIIVRECHVADPWPINVANRCECLTVPHLIVASACETKYKIFCIMNSRNFALLSFKDELLRLPISEAF